MQKIKRITTITGLKRYSSVNKDNSLSFHELLIKSGFTFKHNLKDGFIEPKCRPCNNYLPVHSIHEELLEVTLSSCACSVSSKLAVTEQRFKSVFTEDEAAIAYRKYCKNKMKKWSTAGNFVASLEFKNKQVWRGRGGKKIF